MRKKIIPTLEIAVLDYVKHLSAKRRAELAELFVNSMASWLWYVEVIDRYNLRDPGSRIVLDVAALFPDEAASRLVEPDFSWPVFEAGVILREAKKLVLATT